jgi:hypothetical protein
MTTTEVLEELSALESSRERDLEQARGIQSLMLPGALRARAVTIAHEFHETQVVQIAPGESVVFCTDGIIEALDCHSESFGAERLMDLCSGHRGASGPELLEKIIAAVREFARGRTQHDDMAAIVFHHGAER